MSSGGWFGILGFRVWDRGLVSRAYRVSVESKQTELNWEQARGAGRCELEGCAKHVLQSIVVAKCVSSVSFLPRRCVNGLIKRCAKRGRGRLRTPARVITNSRLSSGLVR